jgi:hypothetical protein
MRYPKNINDDDDGHACDDASHASQLCAFCEPRDAHIGHTHQVPELLPQQLVLPCDVSEHAQDPLSLHVFRTVRKTRKKAISCQKLVINPLRRRPHKILDLIRVSFN